MQGIQESLLEGKAQLGKTPIILVADCASDLDYLSLLLSNHLVSPAKAKTDRPLTIHDNFFTTPFLFHLLRHQTEPIADREWISILDLHLEEGFDNEKLYGLSFNYEQYARLKKSGWLRDKLVLLLFNDLTPDLSISEDKNELTAFIQREFETTSYPIFNTLFFHSQPRLVLQYCCRFIEANIVDDELIQANPFRLPEAFQEAVSKLPNRRSFDVLNKEWSAGKTIQIIFFDIREKQIPTALKRINDLLITFPDSFRIDCLCDKQDTILALQNELHSLVRQHVDIRHALQQKQLSDQLNALIAEADARVLLCDDLRLNYPFCELFEPILNHSTTQSFSRITHEKKPRFSNLGELLTGLNPEHNLLILRRDQDHAPYFDTQFEDAACFWDFLLTRMSHDSQHVALLPADWADAEDFPEITPHPSWTPAIMKKHRALLQQCMDDIVEILSDDSGRARHEVQELQLRLSTLNVMLLHSRDELKSLQHLNGQLHQRLAYMESTWYYQLRQKLQRIKKIFFKKNTPGTGTLRRILHFIRFALSKAGFGIFRKVAAGVFKHLFLLTERRAVDIVYRDEVKQDGIYNYHHWILNKLDSETLKADFEQNIATLRHRPLISIVMPVYNAPLRLLKEAIESVRNQQYIQWELCIADDCSTDEKVKKLLRSYAAKDEKIKVRFRSENGHISAASNTALELATGSYILFMDQDDLLSENCLWEVAKAIQANHEPNIIYSDEDKIDENGFHQSAYFKPDWSPDHLLAKNYIGHVCVIKRELVVSIGGFRLGFEGSQDYDLLLRATEKTGQIVHIPKVLYHWRIHGKSAAQSEEAKPYAYIAAKKALEEALTRRGLSGKVRYLSGLRGYRIDYTMPIKDKVTIIIPTKDQTSLLRNALDSIFRHTDYPHFEILVLNNNSTTAELTNFLSEYTAKYPDRFRSIDAHFPFNFSKLMNLGVRETDSTHLLFLNNDVEVTHPDWLRTMVSFAAQPHIGAVGARLLYPDDTIQHAGVIVGLGGVAGHAFTGQYKDDPGYFNLIQTVNNFTAVTAACLLCRREVFNQVQGMDEDFQVEYNDVDFCLKLLEAGYYNVYVPQVELYHYESATRGHPHQSKVSFERHLREMALFKMKWQKYIDRDPYYNPNLHLGVHDFKMNLQA